MIPRLILSALLVGCTSFVGARAWLAQMPAVGGGGTAGPFVLKAHAGFTGGATGSADVDCSGSNFLLVGIGRFPSGAIVPPADTGSNSYTQIGTEATDGTSNVSLWISTGSPSVSSSFHWGNTMNTQFTAVQGACFSDGSTSSLDQTNQANSANQPGIVNPTLPNELVVTVYLAPSGGSGVPTVSAPFNFLDGAAYSAGATVGGGMAYEIQTTATARNPTWATPGGGNGATLIRTFR